MPGISTVLIVSLMLGGIQLIAIGLIGEYLGRIYDEVKQRPLYIVRDELNVPGDELNVPGVELNVPGVERIEPFVERRRGERRRSDQLQLT